MYDDLEGMKCTYFAALIGCDTKSATEQCGIGFKVKDIAKPISTVSRHADAETTTGAASQCADSSYTIVGYRTLDDLFGFCWILLEAEPCAALLCSLPRKTRKASTSISWSTLNQTRSIMPSYACRNCGCSAKKVQPNPLIQDDRAHEVFLEAAKRASGDAKRARTLQVAPTDQELAEYRACAVPLA